MKCISKLGSGAEGDVKTFIMNYHLALENQIIDQLGHVLKETKYACLSKELAQALKELDPSILKLK